MRARLMMKLMGIIVMLVITVVTAKGCSGGNSSSDLFNPTNVAKNGLSGLCANQEAAAEASGDTSPQTVVNQSELGQLSQTNPGGVNDLEQALGGNTSCTTSTTAGP